MVLTDLQIDVVAGKLSEVCPNSVVKADVKNIWINPDNLLEVCKFLISDSMFQMDYLNAVTAVDFIDHFDVIYQLTSTITQKRLNIRSSLLGRDDLSIDSVTSLWNGANLQEREI